MWRTYCYENFFTKEFKWGDVHLRRVLFVYGTQSLVLYFGIVKVDIRETVFGLGECGYQFFLFLLVNFIELLISFLVVKFGHSITIVA